MNAETVTCRSCGAKIDESALLCPKCGQPNISTQFAGPGYSAPAEGSVAEGQPSPLAPAVDSAPAATVAIEPEKPAGQPVEAAAQPVVPLAPTPPEAGTATIPLPASLLPLGTRPPASAAAEPSEDAFFVPPAEVALPGVPAMLMGVGLGQALDVPKAPESDFEAIEHQQVPSSGPRYTLRRIPWTRSGGRSFPSDPFASPGYDNVAEDMRRVTEPPGWVRWQPRPQTAFLLELLGYVGFLGIGRIYAGQLGTGLGMMVFWWFMVLRVGLVAIRSGEDGLFFVLLFLIAPVAEAWALKRDVEKRFGGA